MDKRIRRYSWMVIALLVLAAALAGIGIAYKAACWEVCENTYSCVIYGCDGGVPVRDVEPTP